MSYFLGKAIVFFFENKMIAVFPSITDVTVLICSQICEELKMDVVPQFCGHGIGSYFHGPPDIYHFGMSVLLVVENMFINFIIKNTYIIT